MSVFYVQTESAQSLPSWCVWLTPAISFHQPFRIERFLDRKQKQNWPIPQWTQMKTCHKIRYNKRRRHWSKLSWVCKEITQVADRRYRVACILPRHCCLDSGACHAEKLLEEWFFSLLVCFCATRLVQKQIRETFEKGWDVTGLG